MSDLRLKSNKKHATMKTKPLYTIIASVALLAPSLASAQTISEELIVISDVPCTSRYYVDASQDWFIQLGAGIAAPFTEGINSDGNHYTHLTVNYNVGVGKWISPYLGMRLAFNGGPLHWNNGKDMAKMKYVGANLDFMWDMCNTFGGVNENRVVSVIPFVGIGGTLSWDYRPTTYGNIYGNDGKLKRNMWTLPVSAGLQLRFRLCSYADFFVETRAGFYGDNWNRKATGRPIDVNMTLNGGFTITFGGRHYSEYNPCEYLSFVNGLNKEVNELREALAATATALAIAESQLPCPEVEETVVEIELVPLMASVRFAKNSDEITEMEMVNVFSTAQWMQAYPNQEVVIMGYADKDTGSASYNMELSERRAKAVRDALVNNYGINPDRLSIRAYGSDSQPFDTNDWNRIVLFSAE